MERTIEQFHADTYDQFFSLFNAYNYKLIGILKSILDRPIESVLDLACGVGHSTLALTCLVHCPQMAVQDALSSRKLLKGAMLIKKMCQ